MFLFTTLFFIFTTAFSSLFANIDAFLNVQPRELFVESLHSQGRTVREFYQDLLETKKKEAQKELCAAFAISEEEWLKLQKKAQEMQASIIEDQNFDLGDLAPYYYPPTNPKASLIYTIIEQEWGSSQDFYVIDTTLTHYTGAIRITSSVDDEVIPNGRRKEVILFCSLDFFNALPFECRTQMLKHELTHLRQGHTIQIHVFSRFLGKKYPDRVAGTQLILTKNELVAYQNYIAVLEYEADILPALEGSDTARSMVIGRQMLQTSYAHILYSTLPTAISSKLLTMASRYTAPAFLQYAPFPENHLRLLQCIQDDLEKEEYIYCRLRH